MGLPGNVVNMRPVLFVADVKHTASVLHRGV